MTNHPNRIRNWLLVEVSKRSDADPLHSERVVAAYASRDDAVAHHKKLAPGIRSLGKTMVDRSLAFDKLPVGAVLHYHVIHRSAFNRTA